LKPQFIDAHSNACERVKSKHIHQFFHLFALFIYLFWTGGKFKSTVHRVALPRSTEEAGERYSIAYFLHPEDDVLLTRVTDNQIPDPSEPVLTARQWLEQKLAATYTGRKTDS